MSDIEHAEPAAIACGSDRTDKPATRSVMGTGRITREAYEGDIVQRLRNWMGLHLAHSGRLFEEAADEIERLRLADAEREAIRGTSHFLCDLAGFDVNEDTKTLLKKNAATLRGLLERTK